MKIIFIAGPYIGDGTYEKIEENIREAEKYQIALANQRVGFFCAHNHTEHFGSGKKAIAPEPFYHEMDLEFLKRIADAILIMPKWEESNGTKNEIAWAKKNGMKMFYPKSPDDIDEIVTWAKQ